MRRKTLSFTAAVICGILYAQLAEEKGSVSFLALSAVFAVLIFGAARFSAGRTGRENGAAAASGKAGRLERAESLGDAGEAGKAGTSGGAEDAAAKKLRFYKSLAAGFLAGAVWFAGYEALMLSGPLHGQEGEPGSFSAVVSEIEIRDEESCRLYLRVGREKVLCNYYRKLEDPWDLIGRTIIFDTTFSTPRGAGNPRTFDYRQYLRSEGIRHTAVIDSFQVTGEAVSAANLAKRLILKKREAMIESLQLPASVEGLIRGILFGDTSQMADDVYEDFRRNGTAHVLAVSGLHVGMIYGLYRSLRKRWKNPALTAVFVLMLLIYGSCALWSVSVRRAVILVLLTLLAELLKRRYDLTTALSAAALLSMAKNPWIIFGAGFQMSFLAVLSMAFLTPALEKLAGESLAAVTAVQLGLMPYMAFTFNYVSLAGFLCNFPVVFLVSILVPAGAAGFFVYLAAGVTVPGLSPLLEGLCRAAEGINALFGGLDFLSFDVVSPPLWAVWGFYLLLFTVCSEHFFVCRKRKDGRAMAFAAAVTAAVVGFSAAAGASPFDRADFVFLDVGQGDSLHVKTAAGRHLLIDGGGKIDYNLGEKTLKPYLLKNGAAEVDLAAATHLHTDHYLGLVQLAECYPVKKLVTEGRAGQRLKLGEDQWIDILWPLEQNPDTEDENLNSLIFRIQMKGVSVLVTGDITEEGERLLLKQYRGTGRLRADVLKVAHHGSAYSTCDDFLSEVNPAAAVISVGKNNYGHPSEKVIEKLQKKGIMVFRTDLCGAVGIINEKGRIRICTENP